MKLKCVQTGVKSWLLLAQNRLVFDAAGPEASRSSAPEAAPVSPVEAARDGVKTEITEPLRAEADVKMDALAEKKAREDKLLQAVKESEDKAKTEGPKDFTNRQKFGSVRFANEHQEAFMNFLELSDGAKARDVVGLDGQIDYTDFEGEDSEGSKAYGFYWDNDGSKWKIDTPGYRLDKKDIPLSYKFEEAIPQIIDIYEKNPGWTALSKDRIPEVVAGLKAAYTKFQILNAKKGEFGIKYPLLKKEGGSVDLAQAAYADLAEKSGVVLNYFKENRTPGWHRISNPDVVKAAFQCGVANVGNPSNLENADAYMYMVVGNQLYRKPIEGGQVQMMEMADQPKNPFKAGDFLEEKHFAGMFHNINFVNVADADVDKALREDLGKNPVAYTSVLGEAPKTDADGKPVAPGETPTLTPDQEKFKQGLFIKDIEIKSSPDVTGAILADSFRQKIQPLYDKKYSLSVVKKGDNPISTTHTPESEAALSARSQVIDALVADFVKKFDAWKTANPKPEKTAKTQEAKSLEVKITPTYEVKAEWKDGRGQRMAQTIAHAGEVVTDKLQSAKDKVAKLLRSKIGKVLAFLGILDEQKLVDHFSGKQKIEGMGIWTFLAGVGDNKQMDKLAEKQPWVAKLKGSVDKLVDKVADMMGIESKDEIQKKYVSGMRELANSGPIQESFTLETQMGDSFGGLVITAQNTDFPVNRFAKYRKIGETEWKEGQLADAKGYEVMVNQALEGVVIPKGVVIGMNQPSVYESVPEAKEPTDAATAEPRVAPATTVAAAVPVSPTPTPAPVGGAEPTVADASDAATDAPEESKEA